jgi:hypothetical protein
MRDGGLAPFGGEGAIIEADETYYGRMETPTKPRAKRSKTANKRPIVSLVQRGGSVRSFHVASADKDTVQTILKQNVDSSSRLYTDESPLYRAARRFWIMRPCDTAQPNTCAAFISIAKRSICTGIGRIRFSLQSPNRTRIQRPGACGACNKECDWQAVSRIGDLTSIRFKIAAARFGTVAKETRGAKAR